jgi:hypothetical protein
MFIKEDTDQLVDQIWDETKELALRVDHLVDPPIDLSYGHPAPRRIGAFPLGHMVARVIQYKQ